MPRSYSMGLSRVQKYASVPSWLYPNDIQMHLTFDWYFIPFCRVTDPGLIMLVFLESSASFQGPVYFLPSHLVN